MHVVWYKLTCLPKTTEGHEFHKHRTHLPSHGTPLLPLFQGGGVAVDQQHGVLPALEGVLISGAMGARLAGEAMHELQLSLFGDNAPPSLVYTLSVNAVSDQLSPASVFRSQLLDVALK